MTISARTVLTILFALILIGAGILYFSYMKQNDTSCLDAVPQPRVTAFGDSLVAGYGATTEGGFVSILSREAGVPISNLGKSGDTTAQAKFRLSEVRSSRPDTTLILLGGNDALQRIPLAETEKNLSEIIEEIQKSGSSIILLGVIGGFPQDPFTAMYKRLAETYKVTYVSNILSGIIGHPNLMSDGIHPNQDGYQKIADRLLPILESECRRLSK